jgi:hypothetical protein
MLTSKFKKSFSSIKKAAQLGGFFREVFCSYRNKVTVPSNLYSLPSKLITSIW